MAKLDDVVATKIKDVGYGNVQHERVWDRNYV
jgi:hypothetical protein